MINFTKHFSTHITPEWRSQYLRYEHLKKMLHSAIDKAPSLDIVESRVVEQYFADFDEKFFTECTKELKKINTFYSQKLAESTRRHAALKIELKKVLRETKSIHYGCDPKMKKIHAMKQEFSEFYLSVILLQEYRKLNYTGFEEIMIKYDQMTASNRGVKWFKKEVENSHFYTNTDVAQIIKEVESTVINDLEKGDRQRAMKKLRVPPFQELESPLTALKIGWFSGAFIVLTIIAIISAYKKRKHIDWKIIIHLYRAPFLIILIMFLWGVNIHFWRVTGVNHVLIFELDPRSHLQAQDVMEMAAMFAVLWSLSVLAFLYSPLLNVPQYLFPFVLAVLMFVFLVNPTKTFRYKARFWTLRILSRIVVAPLVPLKFPDFWLADQLCSLSIVLSDLMFFICFYINWYSSAKDTNSGRVLPSSGYCSEEVWKYYPFVLSIPYWLRFAQCMRRYIDTNRRYFEHIANAVKYATSFSSHVLSYYVSTHFAEYDDINQNPYFYCWVALLSAASIYCYYWDVCQDWGLFDKNSGDNMFLREEIVYTHSWYYFAIIINFIIRFFWIFSTSAFELNLISNNLTTSIGSTLEVFRRFVWNFFRLENEHLNNCGKFRAVRDIFVVPTDAEDQQEIIKMMDEEDGVVNKRVQKQKRRTTMLLSQKYDLSIIV